METNSIAALRAIDVSSIANDTIIFVKGYFSPGDGGGGTFIYQSASTRSDNGGIYIEPSAGAGVWKRLYDGAINIKWFGAIGNESNPEDQYINNAITYVKDEFGYGEIIIPPAWYKLDGDITTWAGITLKGIGNPYFFRKGSFSSTNYFVTINPSDLPSDWVHSKVVLDGIMFAGDESYSGGPSNNYKTNLTALRILTNSFHINNCAFFGFDKTTKFESHSYLVSFNECSFRQNNYGFHYDFNGLTDSGENIKIINSVIGGNNFGIYNNLGGLYINNCSLDYNGVHIQGNISKVSGVLSVPFVIDNCHIENSVAYAGTGFRINNSSEGVLIVSNSVIFDDNDKIFNNSGLLILTNNSYRMSEGKYIASSTGLVTENNSVPISNASIARVSINNSGIKNGSFDKDLLEGWSLSAGTNAVTVNSNTYDSSKALKISPTDLFTGTYLISDFIAIPVDKRGYVVSCFVTHSTHFGNIHVLSYDRNKNFITDINVSIGQTTNPVNMKLQQKFVEKAEFLRIEIRCANGDVNNAIYIDDFYINYLTDPD